MEEQKDLVVGFLDVKRAHFVSKARRRIHVELPPELQDLHPGKVALLQQSLYGTRDAATNWEFAVRDLLVGLGFVQGVASPCNYWHPQRKTRTTVHGDDFTTLGTFKEAQWFHESVAKMWNVEVRGILGPPGRRGCISTMRHLNRIVSWTHEGITWELDPRHVELLVRDVGVSGTSVKTPLVKEKVDDLNTPDVPLQGTAATLYRSHTMRLGYLAQDRTDLQRTTRELAKGMSEPTERHMVALKRAVRY